MDSDVDNDGRLTVLDLQRLAQLRNAFSGKPEGEGGKPEGEDDKRASTDEQSKRRWRAARRATVAFAKMNDLLDGKIHSLVAAQTQSLQSKTWPDGTTYTGSWASGQPAGHGKTVWKDGTAYEGLHEKGLPHGFGTLTYPDGARWEGAWDCGKKHGRGVKISPTGERDEGEWVNGERAIWAEGGKPGQGGAAIAALEAIRGGKGGSSMLSKSVKIAPAQMVAEDLTGVDE